MLDASTKSVAATIAARAVALSATKVYDGTVSLAGAVTIATGVTGETLAYTGAVASDANVATNGKVISAITLADGTGLASDYTLPAQAGAVTITPKTVALSATKTYDGSTGLYDAPNDATLYIGLATNRPSAVESSVKTDYVWSKFRGDQGVPGAPGAAAPTLYTWVKYADTASRIWRE